MRLVKTLIAGGLAILTVGVAGWVHAETIDNPQWRECAGEGMEQLECAAVETPVDWRRPDGESMNIEISRRAAEDPKRRVGVLVVNPGGPGAAGTVMPAQAQRHLAPEVLERFDIVGFDPRGVGASEGIECEVGLATTIPADAGQYAELLDERREQARRCDGDNPVLPHIDTVSAARDIDRIRESLGEETISYFAGSYGTQLGATYAELFGDRLRGMALDAMAEHTVDQESMATAQAEAREESFARFAAWCDGESDCAAGVDDVASAWDRLIVDADEAPLEAPDVPDVAPDGVDGSMIVDGTAALLASKEITWPMLGEAISTAVAQRDGSGFAEMFVDDGSVGAMVGIRCLDWPSDDADRDFAHVSAAAEESARQAPRFGANAQWYYRPECLEWSHEAVNPPRDWRIGDDAPSIQIVGGLHDPSTPYETARRAAERFPDAALLTYTGDGHFSSAASRCVRDAVGRYLIQPGEGAVQARCP